MGNSIRGGRLWRGETDLECLGEGSWKLWLSLLEGSKGYREAPIEGPGELWPSLLEG